MSDADFVEQGKIAWNSLSGGPVNTNLKEGANPFAKQLWPKVQTLVGNVVNMLPTCHNVGQMS